MRACGRGDGGSAVAIGVRLGEVKERKASVSEREEELEAVMWSLGYETYVQYNAAAAGDIRRHTKEGVSEGDATRISGKVRMFGDKGVVVQARTTSVTDETPVASCLEPS